MFPPQTGPASQLERSPVAALVEFQIINADDDFQPDPEAHRLRLTQSAPYPCYELVSSGMTALCVCLYRLLRSGVLIRVGWSRFVRARWFQLRNWSRI